MYTVELFNEFYFTAKTQQEADALKDKFDAVVVTGAMLDYDVDYMWGSHIGRGNGSRLVISLSHLHERREYELVIHANEDGMVYNITLEISGSAEMEEAFHIKYNTYCLEEVNGFNVVQELMNNL